MNRLITTLCAAALAGGASSALAQDVRFDDVVRNLRNPDPKIRSSSVRLLREARHAEAIVPMAPLVNDPIDEIQLEAIGAELSFYLVEDVPTKKRVALFVEVRSPGAAMAAFEQGPLAAWPRSAPPELLTALMKAVDDENGKVRLEAIYAFGIIARPPLAEEHTQALVKALDHYDAAIRTAAARVAGRVEATGAGDALIKAVNDSNAQVRYAAMRALGEIGEPRAVQALTEQLNFYGKGEGAWSALHALALIAHPSSVPVFKERLRHKDSYMRRAAMEGLGRTKDTSEVSALEEAAGSDDSEMVRAAAGFALQYLGRNYVARLVESLDSPKMAPQIAGYLLELGPGVLQALTPHLQDQDAAIRANVAQILGGIGGETAVAALRPLLQDKDKDVVKAATRAIDRAKIQLPPGT